ncbi:MAG: PAT family beta-lactamase induction signal transducer AmpG [Cellvibrionaceae bacterium]|jgi:PAT family beta-lactamase induction signal transducer AmpG
MVYRHPRVIAIFFLGFAAGLPLLLVFSTLTAWLRDNNISHAAIGFFGWVGITYSIKVFWAPIVDRLPIPFLTSFLGKRRSWIILSQLGVVLGLVVMAKLDPLTELTSIALLAVWIAFSSATQDISIDAYRIEAAVSEYQGAMSASYIFGYRVALLVAGAGALYIADEWSWIVAYQIMALFMLVGIVTILFIEEPFVDSKDKIIPHTNQPLWLRFTCWFKVAIVGPFVDFFQRNGRFALMVLLLIAVYRLSDITMGIMANPFYLDLGFSKSQIAAVGKVYGFFMTLFGAFLGGLMVVRYGIFRPLIAGAILVAATNILFATLSTIGADIDWLALTISADNLSGGFASSAFIAYLSSLTNRAYTATQYALFSSLMTLPGKFISGFSGMIVGSSGYFSFFILAAILGIPAIICSYIVYRHDGKLSEKI